MLVNGCEPGEGVSEFLVFVLCKYFELFVINAVTSSEKQNTATDAASQLLFVAVSLCESAPAVTLPNSAVVDAKWNDAFNEIVAWESVESVLH